jgi:hypothetical protein
MKTNILKYFLTLILFININYTFSATYFSRASGNWNATASWSTVACGGAAATSTPGAADDVIICNGHTITINGANASALTLNVNAGGFLTWAAAGAGKYTLTVSGLTTVSGTITIVNSGGTPANATLQCNGNVTINNGGVINNNGVFNMANSTTYTINNGGTYNHNPRVSDAANQTMFNRTGATNTFGVSSTIVMLNWSSSTVPLGQYAPSWGNITFSPSNLTVWNQSGTFAPNKIKGNVSITSVQVNFDEGAGGTTSLTIDGTVSTSGTGGVLFAQGANRNLTLTTGAFTHNGSGLAAGMYETHGVLNWTVNGDFTVNRDFTAIQGGATPVASTCSVTVNGNMNIGGTTLFDFNRQLGSTNSPCNITVTGDMTVTTTGWFRCIDAGIGNLNINVTGNMTFNTTSNSNNLKSCLNSSSINCAGDVVITVGGNFVHNNSGNVYLLGDLSCFAFPTSVPCTQGGSNSQSVTLNVTGQFIADNNINKNFYGTNVRTIAGTYTGNYGSINWQGGSYISHSGLHTGTGAVNHTITGNASFTSTSGTNQVILVNTLSTNSISNNLNIGGNFTFGTLGGPAGFQFVSSGASGNETLTVGGNFTVNSGDVYFNGTETVGTDHNITANITGNLQINGGITRFSSRGGSATVTVNGNTNIAAGELSLKVGTGSGTMTVNGNYSQTGGTFFIHKSITATPNASTVTINGDFSHTGGTIDFDGANSTVTNQLFLNGPNCTLGGSGIITRSNGAGTASVFGEMYYNRSGTIAFNRSAATHQINQVRQIIVAACTLNASGSANYLQLACNSSAGVTAIPPTIVMLDVLGTLNMGSNQIIGRSESATQRPTSLIVRTNGNLITANANGFYGTASTTVHNLTRNSANTNNTVNSLSWFLEPNSMITYNGTANQVLTGKFPANFTTATISDVVAGTNAGYKYAILNIDHQGTLGTNFVNPVLSNVFIRNRLDMTRGELFLNANRIVVENPAGSAIARNGITQTGYIKSENVLNAGIVQWNIGTTTGAHIFPFGVTTGAANYIPFTFDLTAGDVGNVSVATYPTNFANLPYPTTPNLVTHVNDVFGVDNSANTVDRFWQIDKTGPSGTATMTFIARASEVGTITNLVAQRWNQSNLGWVLPAPGQTSLANGAIIPGVTVFSPWTLSGNNSPLPIKLISFDGEKNNNTVDLFWVTASEVNNDYFTIERSFNGIDYHFLQTIKGKGTTNEITNYRTADFNPQNGVNYYRLKQTDFDGKFEYVGTIAVEFNKTTSGLSLYPNPVKDNLELNFNSDNKGDVNIQVFDLNGKLVYFETVATNEGFNRLLLNTKSFTNGMYFLVIFNEFGAEKLKFVKE